MRLLVTWASKRGGTEGIGRIVAETLTVRGFEVTAAPVERAGDLTRFDAVVLGGALYAFRWTGTLRRFVARHRAALRRVPVWCFSSGPLDDSADRDAIPAPREVEVLMERIGAIGHVTFGGRLAPDARGFPASAMAKTKSGDWRRPEAIRAWADSVADALPAARPGTPVDHPAYAVTRWLRYGVAGAALAMGARVALAEVVGPTLALLLFWAAVLVLFGALAGAYFRARGSRDPFPTAVLWALLVLLFGIGLDLLPGFTPAPGLLRRVLALAVPALLAFAATLASGTMAVMMPRQEPGGRAATAHR
ncbi:MAG: flavodoxin domain-containing protein [Vicinamibacterales bacterium]